MHSSLAHPPSLSSSPVNSGQHPRIACHGSQVRQEVGAEGVRIQLVMLVIIECGCARESEREREREREGNMFDIRIIDKQTQ